MRARRQDAVDRFNVLVSALIADMPDEKREQVMLVVDQFLSNDRMTTACIACTTELLTLLWAWAATKSGPKV